MKGQICNTRKVTCPQHVAHTRPVVQPTRRGHLSRSIPSTARIPPIATTSAFSSDVTTGLLPAGQLQTKVKLPAIFLRFDAADISNNAAMESLESALLSSVSAVVLSDSASGGGDLFMAAAGLRAVIRGRCLLLVEDRVDIAAAAQADGAVLTSRGMPLAAARLVLSGGQYLVGKSVTSAESAATAAADGASFLLLEAPEGTQLTPEFVLDTVTSQRSGLNIPIIANVESTDPSDISNLRSVFSQGLSGIGGTASALVKAGSALGEPQSAGLADCIGSIAQALAPPKTETPTSEEVNGSVAVGASKTAAPAMLSRLLKPQQNTVLEMEKQVMSDIIEFLEGAVSEMDEVRLLYDAVAALDEAFLVVVVGEFNSGKSSMVNALLGQRVLEEGILPTTNEISVLKYSDGEPEVERTSDGLFVRYQPSKLLKRINIVDTPGTNVILGRQQRLTEEFVPRADLVLFIMSADRPFTESEVKFLRYIKQWGKKVVFVLNKVDIFNSMEDVQQVRDFVTDNAKTLLGVDSAYVLTVSARLALGAKLACGSDESGGIVDPDTVSQSLLSNADWQKSQFTELEAFMLEFLTGGSGSGVGGGSESVRLKLQTPVFVAEALLQAAEQQLDAELKAAETELAAVRTVGKQIEKFKQQMDADSASQRQALNQQLTAAAVSVGKVITDTVQLQNTPMLTTYVFGDSSSTTASPIAKVVTSALESSNLGDLPERVRGHASWLQTNTGNQLDTYSAFVNQRKGNSHGPAPSSSDLAETSSEDAQSLVLAKQINVTSMSNELESQVRDVVMGTATSAGGAASVGAVMTTILPTTIEDLLALALTGSVIYMSVLNLPLKRSEIKTGVLRRYQELSKRIEGEMEQELNSQLNELQVNVTNMVRPVELLAIAEVEDVKQKQADLEVLRERLSDIKTETTKL